MFKASRAEASVTPHSLGEECDQDGRDMICLF